MRRLQSVHTMAVFVLLMSLSGCALDWSARDSDEAAQRIGKGGAQLWAENCRHCHNFRAPTSYSADQWEVAVNHMRIRAGLTTEEARSIAAFLKAAH
jgi:nitrate/TMAO reductase-like tetraheme cytochrome c subunit